MMEDRKRPPKSWSGCLALSVALALLACGEQEVISDASVQGGNLFYGRNAEFSIGVSRLREGLQVQVSGCSVTDGLQAVSPTELRYRCTLTTTGTVNFTVGDPQGATVYTRTFTVPEPRVVLDTSRGEIEIELQPRSAPLTVDNFLAYVGSDYYTNLIFHRVITGFVVQAGGFEPGMNPRVPPLPPVVLESNRGLLNVRGSLAMARTNAPDSATSQFFINLVDNPFLDFRPADTDRPESPGYAVFGRVVRGIEAVDAIAAVPTTSVAGFSDVPTDNVLIRSARRIR
jgi:cyclophilin family peptidyl-prolyl cis-trans isomerase